MTALYLGIDPGSYGAAFLRDRAGRSWECADLPTGELSDYADKLRDLLHYMVHKPSWGKQSTAVYAAIEKQTRRPRDSNKGLERTLGAYRIIKEVLKGLGVEYVEVAPNTWQANLGWRKALGSTKPWSVKLATQLYPWPANPFIGEKGGLKHGRSDAALMAHYAVGWFQTRKGEKP